MDASKNVCGNSFTPVQPLTMDAKVSYLTVPADPLISDYVFYYWQIKSTERLLSSFQYKVVADSCIDLFLDLNNLTEGYVNGFTSASTNFELGENFNYVGIRFRPGAFPSIFDIDASELANQCIPLEILLTDVFNTLTQLLEKLEDIRIISKIFDYYLKTKITSKQIRSDLRFIKTLNVIYSTPKIVNIEKNLTYCISARQLRRLYKFYVGSSPASFNKVVRFQKYLGLTALNPGKISEKLYFDLGYYDQSHFIKDFKQMFGTVPSVAFKSYSI